MSRVCLDSKGEESWCLRVPLQFAAKLRTCAAPPLRRSDRMAGNDQGAIKGDQRDSCRHATGQRLRKHLVLLARPTGPHAILRELSYLSINKRSRVTMKDNRPAKLHTPDPTDKR
jgi:hypothetical protein